MNKLEQLQQKSTGIIFIKSYPVLNHINSLTPTDKNLIELVLSYQENNQIFKMKYEKTCSVLNIKLQTLKNTVKKLKDSKILITKHQSNYNGTNGGSSTELSIDMDYLIQLVEKSIQYPQSDKEPEIIKQPSIEIKEVSNQRVVDKNEIKKQNLKKVFEDRYKFINRNAGSISISPADFHSLTKNYFLDKFEIKDFSKFTGLMSNDFDAFWERVQELKEEIDNRKNLSTIEK
jgi:hypothetical protein